MPTAWSIASSFVRRPAPRWTAALPTPIALSVETYPARGAGTGGRPARRGSADSSAVPPCASIQRCQAASARAVGDRGLGAAPALGLVDPEIREREQPGARVEHELGEVGGPVPAHRVARLLHLERVADRGAERLVHVGEQAHDLAAGVAGRARASSRRGPRASSSVFMNAPSPTLTSSTIACAPAASFFDMIEAAISEMLVDRRR